MPEHLPDCNYSVRLLWLHVHAMTLATIVVIAVQAAAC